MNHLLKGKPIKYILICAVILAYFSPHSLIFAQSNSCNGNPCPPTLLEMLKYFQPIIGTMQSISIIVFFIIISYSGFSFITSGGDKEKIQNAKKGLFVSMIGFAIIFLPFFVFPMIVNITGLQNSISTKNGQITFNTSSSFTPTPLPSYLIDTDTPTPTFPPPPPAGQVPPPTGTHNADTCAVKVTYCLPVFFSTQPTNNQDGTTLSNSGNFGNYGEYRSSKYFYDEYSLNDQSLYASIADVMDAYLVKDGNLADVTIIDAINGNPNPTDLYNQNSPTLAQDISTTANNMIKLTPHNKVTDARWRATISSSQEQFTNFAHAGIPMIVMLDTYQYVVVKDYSGGTITYIDPSRTTEQIFRTGAKYNSDGTQSVDINTFMANSTNTFIALQPVDANDYINKYFGQRDLYSVIMAECIAYHESSFYPNATNSNTNGSIDEGLMQINSVHWGAKTPMGVITQSDLFDPEFNVQAGYTLYIAQSFKIWSTYHFCW